MITEVQEEIPSKPNMGAAKMRTIPTAAQKGWEDVALQNEGLMFSKDCTQGFTGVDSGLFDQFCTILSWVHDGYANMEKELGKERERKLMECARKRELGET
eukprot:1184950-Prorocentrum_minimum.AAC.6